MFIFYLWEKYYQLIAIQYWIANYASWVPRLTLLDLGTNWTYERALGTELIRRGLRTIPLLSHIVFERINCFHTGLD